MSRKWTHAQLVKKAAQYLRRTGHKVVVTEIGVAQEEPDAIGFKGGITTVIECKASRPDFLADLKKPYRSEHGTGLGSERIYLTPEGLLDPDELPAGWGLIEMCKRGGGWIVSRVRPPLRFDANRRNVAGEQQILVSCLRRIGQDAPRGVSVSCYTFDTKGTVTLGILEEGDEPEGEGDSDNDNG